MGNNVGRMVAPYTLILTSNESKKAWPPRKTPQNDGYIMSAELRWAGGASAVCMWFSGVKKAFDVGGPHWIDFCRMRSSEAAMGRGGRAAPRWGGNELKKTGARSARARTRGQNPLVSIYSPICSKFRTRARLFHSAVAVKNTLEFSGI